MNRVEDLRILTGTGRYVDDVLPTGTLHAAFVRSQVAHGRIVKVDVEGARGAQGVIAVFTGQEIEDLVLGPGAHGLGSDSLMPSPQPAYTVLCTDKVRLVGDPIVMIVAESRHLAEDACELVQVDIDQLPAVATAAAALDPSSPLIFDDLAENVIKRAAPVKFGDVEKVFASADRVISAHIDMHRHQNVPMEGRGIVADFDPSTGDLTVTTGTRRLHLVRTILAERLGLDPARVHVRAGDIGGAFGSKFASSREELSVALASKVLGRPVKWTEDRSENLLFSGQAREESWDVEAAVSNEGDILGLRVAMIRDSGAYPGVGPLLDRLFERILPGPYKIQAYSFESISVITNKATYIAYRAPWAGETFLRERMFDLAARELGLEPLQVRMRNVVKRDEPPFDMITGQSLVSVTNRESLERITELVDFAEFRRLQTQARAEGRLVGVGVATYVEASPGPRPKDGTPLGAEQAWIRLDADGTVVLTTGQMPHGQSIQTALSQIVADEMGVTLEQVRVEYGDTDTAPAGATGGSRSASFAGGAALVASRELRQNVLNAAAEILEASPEDLDIVRGMVGVKGVPGSAISLAQLVQSAAPATSSDAESRFESVINYTGGEGGWSSGTHCAIVEIDAETGATKVNRWIVVDDCGVVINPAVVNGQIRGAVAQAIGAVLLEHSVYDDEGQFLTGSFMDYLLPTADDIPEIEIHHVESVLLDADVNFRGIGEGGMVVGPSALCGAIEDALSHLGVRVYEQYLPPTRILELMGTIEPERRP
ncbi:MAG: xanthine dehydrogenase family protein [Actinobacteria bacterium]|nr:xanthine dehydrogenase family protein [Actinomycetota bacterium]